MAYTGTTTGIKPRNVSGATRTGNYQQVLSYATSSGQAGQIVPQQVGPGGKTTYSFVPSGGGGGQSKITYAQPAAPVAGGMNAEALAAIQKAKAYYAPGGGFGKGVEAGLERGRVKTVSAGMQNLVSAGLAGTTMAGGLGKRYEEEVAGPTRAGVEGQRAQAISGIEMAQAGMQFQAGQTLAQRSLQMYIAELQARLSREQMGVQMAMANRPTTSMVSPYQPAGQAKQFPSLYGQDAGAAPSLMGGADADYGGVNIPMGPMLGETYYGQPGREGYTGPAITSAMTQPQKKPSARTQASYVGPGY